MYVCALVSFCCQDYYKRRAELFVRQNQLARRGAASMVLLVITAAQGMGNKVWGTRYGEQGMGNKVWGTRYGEQGMGNKVWGTSTVLKVHVYIYIIICTCM